MALIPQNSRISHHTLTTSGATFSVPSSEDFTDGSWTAKDLCQSEIGVNETDKRVFMRVGSEIVEFQTNSVGTYSEPSWNITQITLTQSQILNLGTPIEILPYAGTNSYYDLDYIRFEYIHNTTPYNPGSANGLLIWDGGYYYYALVSILAGSGLISDSFSKTVVIKNITDYFISGIGYKAAQEINNNGLRMFISTDNLTNLTAGDGDLRIIIKWRKFEFGV